MTKRILTLLAIGASIASASAQTTDNSFVGKWKLNPEKSQFTGLTYKMEDLGDNTYRLVFGDDSDNIKADGKDHPTKYGSTWALSSDGKNTWKFTQKRNGKVTSENTWKISDDDQTLTANSEEKRPDGSTSRGETILKRTAGSSGLAGTWESTQVKIGSPTTIQIAKWQDGFSLSEPAYKQQLQFRLDGKDYTPKGPRVAPGTTVSAKKTDDRSIELTYKLKGKVTETDAWQLSQDGKTLTSTITYPGVNKQEVDVFERE